MLWRELMRSYFRQLHSIVWLLLALEVSGTVSMVPFLEQID